MCYPCLKGENKDILAWCSLIHFVTSYLLTMITKTVPGTARCWRPGRAMGQSSCGTRPRAKQCRDSRTYQISRLLISHATTGFYLPIEEPYVLVTDLFMP